MQLKLSKAIVFFDLETTGVNVASDRIVELSALKINIDGSKELKTTRINPTIPIPAHSSAVHGIYDEHVKDAPVFKQLAKSLASFIDGCDLAGYNSNKFDVPLLAEEFLRAEIDFDVKDRRLIDVQNIFHQMEQRTLAAAYKFYCNKTLENAHSAEADATATWEILEAQLERYADTLKNDVQFLHEFSCRAKNVDLAGRIIYNDKGIEVFSFGKHASKSVTETFKIEPSYYDWMMKGDFPIDTKKKLTAIKLEQLKNK